MDDHNHTLSLRLYEVLDKVGASEEMRDKYREVAIVSEIVWSMVSHLDLPDDPHSMYVLGSYGEGTTTTGLNSDKDNLVCLREPVVEIISDASPHPLSYLIVTDDTTKPGYCKLQQLVSSNYPEKTTVNKCVTDQYGRMWLQHFHVNASGDEHQEINGPALTRTGVIGMTDQDVVLALTCHHIPSFATSWVTRVASCNRLNQTQINMLKEFGCFFVGKNHPSSKNDPVKIQWRLSFSLQERELMSRLNPTQHKCYILLKMIKKDILHKRVPESISSYHCKTCVLYAIEKTPFEFWTRRNLLECVRHCIKLLLDWVKEQYCPNYFIPRENMFDGIEHSTLRQVQSVLDDMVEHWYIFIWSITCDDIGNELSRVLSGCGPSTMRVQHNNVSEKALPLYLSLIRSIRQHTLSVHNQCKSMSASSSIVELHSMQTKFLLTDRVRDHTEQQTRQALRYFLPHISLQIAQCIASIMLSNIDTYRLRMFVWLHYIEESKNCDTISAYLIIASYRFQSDRNDICENILLQCETSLKSHVISVCRCNKDRPIQKNEVFNEIERMLCSQDIPYTEFARTCTAGCLAFLPHQTNLVPSALHYEMYRSAPPDSRDDGMVVDSKVYLYFMQYVLYSKTNKPVYKQDAVDNLLHVINTDPHLGHKETAYNLLGWIYKQENKIQRAMECFLISWGIRPIHNAAKWHVLLLLYLYFLRSPEILQSKL